MDEKTFLTEEEIEEALLGALLIDDEAIIKVIDILKVEDFLKKENQIVYQVILELFEKRIGIDMITVSTRLKEKKLVDSIGGQGYLVYLIHKAPNVSNVVSYAKLIKTKKARRDLLEISKIIQELAQDETKDAEELIDEVEKNIFKVAERVYPYEFANIGSLLDESLKRIEELQKGRIIRGVPTGFSKLDEYLGGLQKSDLIILASRPSQGKTALALNIARYLAVQENVPVGVFSLEMSKDQIIDRLISAEAGVSLWKLRTGRLISEGDVDELALVYEAAERLKRSPIFIDDSPSLNNLQIRTMSRKLKHEIGELGLIIIDYLQLIRSGRFIENRVQEVSEISKSLKELARELEIPVLAISQLSRAPEQRVSQIPRLSDLRESGCLSYDSLIMSAETGELLKIGELVGKKDIPVFSLDENWNVVKGKISKVFCSGEKMIYELRTKSGFKIKASVNHPFRKIDGWYRLDELKIGDKIAVAKEINLNEINPNPNVDVVPKEFWQKIALLKNSFNLSWRDFARNYGMSYCGSTLLKHGISKNRLLKIAEFMPHSEIINLANSQIFWDEIVEIRPLGVEKVYDATVPIYHNFLANGIFVHNSLEQDSDVVMFIHRPREVGTNLPTNQVNIIIAKHRNGPIGSIDLYFDPETVSFYSLETQPEEIEFH